MSGAPGIFLRRGVIDDIGMFDEELGPGAGTLWGCGEDSDYLMRVVARGFKVAYHPQIQVFHPSNDLHVRQKEFGRAYGYGAGSARVWRKNLRPTWFLAYQLTRSLFEIFMGMLEFRWSKARYHWCVFLGRIKGWGST